VVGFDGIELSEFCVPSLTTIRQDRLAMGRQAAAMLRERLDSPSEPAAQRAEATVDVGVALLVRDSTAPPPPTAAIA
jgi:LacI family repressor for deo operon, udp, cdd, tsx, nupC, and nupG